MASAGKKRGAGERVLEGRHVIGLFMLMLLFSAVFFTLGYVMGRNQYDGQVRAATTQRVAPDTTFAGKPDAAIKHSSNVPVAPAAEHNSSSDSAPASDWEFYTTDKQKGNAGDDHLRPVSPMESPSTVKGASPSSGSGRNAANSDSPRTAQTSGGYILQVTAVRRESDALELAKRLQKKRFPAYVLSPQGNKYYRVQVGPFGDQKSAEAARKGLESAGFRAIVKRG
jgi:cell division septation protein DedD